MLIKNIKGLNMNSAANLISREGYRVNIENEQRPQASHYDNTLNNSSLDYTDIIAYVLIKSHYFSIKPYKSFKKIFS